MGNLSGIKFGAVAGARPAVPEATRTNNCYSQKILLTWNARSAKTNVSHRSTQYLSRRLILAPNRRPTPDLHRRPIYIDENGNLYDQDGLLRNATGLKLDAQGNVHAQQYQKQQGQTPAILRRSCSLGTNDPQRPTFHIARRSSFHVDRFSHPTVDRHPTFIVDRSTSFDIDRYYTAYIDRSSVAKHGCDCYSQTGREWKPV
ncbi:hypothetical protein DY000_02048276 [Brassica cretica]|uniref:Uncharacterized protein n=1 Tax=Brassica cretica TaxID=69181 RepID=A0ABQ7FAN4_BRACR|nr:hypothetical protein DY000_02048276 [Brassica cretica]